MLVVFVFVFYFVPDAKQKLGLFPEKTFQEAIQKYGVVDDEDMKNLIDNLQTDVSRRYYLYTILAVRHADIQSSR